MPPLIDSCNDGWKFDTSELGGKVKRMSTCITDVIEFEIVFAIIGPTGCPPSRRLCRPAQADMHALCGSTLLWVRVAMTNLRPASTTELFLMGPLSSSLRFFERKRSSAVFEKTCAVHALTQVWAGMLRLMLFAILHEDDALSVGLVDGSEFGSLHGRRCLDSRRLRRRQCRH